MKTRPDKYFNIPVGYFFKENDQAIEDETVFGYLSSDAKLNTWNDSCEYMAMKACEHAWHHVDGWEWIRTSAVITLVIDGKEVGDYWIELDSTPVFRVSKK